MQGDSLEPKYHGRNYRRRDLWGGEGGVVFEGSVRCEGTIETRWNGK